MLKKTTLVVVVVLLILAISMTFVYAQGRGARMGRCGQQPAGTPGMCGMAQSCPMGTGAGRGAGGWWSRVQPQTEAQKAFVAEIRGLHDQIGATQFELNGLRASNGDPKRIQEREQELARLRTRLHDVLWNNRELRMQMGGKAGLGMGPCGPGMPANCPMIQSGQCPAQCCPMVQNGQCVCKCTPEDCAKCPYKDQCKCPRKAK